MGNKRALNALIDTSEEAIPFAKRLVKQNLDLIDGSGSEWYYALARNIVNNRPFGTDAFYLHVEKIGEAVRQTLFSVNLLPNTVFMRSVMNGAASDWVSNDTAAFQYDMETVRRESNLEVTLKSNNETFTFLIDATDAMGTPEDTPVTITVVDALPETGVGSIVYFCKTDDTADNNRFKEFMWVDDAWEEIGYQNIDYSIVWLKDEMKPISNAEMDALFAEAEAKREENNSGEES